MSSSCGVLFGVPNMVVSSISYAAFTFLRPAQEVLDELGVRRLGLGDLIRALTALEAAAPGYLAKALNPAQLLALLAAAERLTAAQESRGLPVGQQLVQLASLPIVPLVGGGVASVSQGVLLPPAGSGDSSGSSSMAYAGGRGSALGNGGGGAVGMGGAAASDGASGTAGVPAASATPAPAAVADALGGRDVSYGFELRLLLADVASHQPQRSDQEDLETAPGDEQIQHAQQPRESQQDVEHGQQAADKQLHDEQEHGLQGAMDSAYTAKHRLPEATIRLAVHCLERLGATTVSPASVLHGHVLPSLRKLSQQLAAADEKQAAGNGKDAVRASGCDAVTRRALVGFAAFLMHHQVRRPEAAATKTMHLSDSSLFAQADMTCIGMLCLYKQH